MPFFRSSLLLATSTSLLVAHSAPPEHDPVALENVIVTAHPYARAQSDVAQPTSVLAGRQLALQQGISLGDLIDAETGVSATAFAPGASRPIIRGLGGDRLRVLQNAIGTIDASVISPDHAVALDPLLIERVEVVRGPASLLYGSSAVGGVVNVIAHRIHQTAPAAPVEGRIEARAGSVSDERSGGVVLEGGEGRFAWHLDGFRRVADNVEIPGYAESERLRELEEEEPHEHEEDEDHDEHEEEEAVGFIPNTAVRSDGGALGFSFVGDRGYAGLSFSGFNSLYGIPPGGHAHGHEEEEPHEEEDEDEHHDEGVQVDLRQRRVDVEAEWQVEGAFLRSLRFRGAHSDYRHQELEGGEVGTLFTNRGHEARLELSHQPLGSWNGTAGLQVARSRFSAVGEEAFLPPSRTRQLALFLFEEAELAPWTVQVGARLERQRTEAEEATLAARRDHAASVSAGLIRELNETWSIALSLNRTQRPPNAQELYADGPHVGTQAYERGDATLTRETSTGVDLSLRRRTGRATGSVTLFANQFDDFIYESATGGFEDGLPVYQYRQDKARFAGAEADLVVHLHETESQLLDLTLGADLVRGRLTDAGANLPRITPPRVRGGLDFARGPFSAQVEVQHVFAQDHVAPAELPTDGYTLVALAAGWRFTLGSSTLDLLLRGTNLTDEEARMHTSFLKEFAPLPGRNITLAVRASF